MRVELRLGLFFLAVNTVASYFFSACFISGMCTVLGIFFIIVSVLPKELYDNLLYRKLIAVNNKHN